MSSNIVNYEKLAMNRVDTFYRYSIDQQIMRCIATIESVDITDQSSFFGFENFVININAVILSRKTPHNIKFSYIGINESELADLVTKFQSGTSWMIYGRFSLDWDNKCIEIGRPEVESLPDNLNWVSDYIRDNSLAVKDFLCDRYGA